MGNPSSGVHGVNEGGHCPARAAGTRSPRLRLVVHDCHLEPVRGRHSDSPLDGAHGCGSVPDSHRLPLLVDVRAHRSTRGDRRSRGLRPHRGDVRPFDAAGQLWWHGPGATLHGKRHPAPQAPPARQAPPSTTSQQHHKPAAPPSKTTTCPGEAGRSPALTRNRRSASPADKSDYRDGRSSERKRRRGVRRGAARPGSSVPGVASAAT